MMTLGNQLVVNLRSLSEEERRHGSGEETEMENVSIAQGRVERVVCVLGALGKIFTFCFDHESKKKHERTRIDRSFLIAFSKLPSF